MRTKGQIFTLDMIMAVTLLVAILVTSIWLSNHTIQQIVDQKRFDDAKFYAHTASELLATTPGSPPNWCNLTLNTTYVSSIGLASGTNVLAEYKVERLFETNSTYNATRQLLGISGRYEYQLSIIDSSGKLTHDYGAPRGSTRLASVVERVALYRGSPVTLRTTVWEAE